MNILVVFIAFTFVLLLAVLFFAVFSLTISKIDEGSSLVNASFRNVTIVIGNATVTGRLTGEFSSLARGYLPSLAWVVVIGILGSLAIYIMYNRAR